MPLGTLSSIRRASGLEQLSMSEYVVIYEHAEDGGWGAYIPDLPGVVALGATRAEAAKLIAEAIAAYAQDRRERGQAMPAPHHAAGVVAAWVGSQRPISQADRREPFPPCRLESTAHPITSPSQGRGQTAQSRLRGIKAPRGLG